MKLHRQPRPPCLPARSFVTKVEAFLRFAGLAYSKRIGATCCNLPLCTACCVQGLPSTALAWLAPGQTAVLHWQLDALCWPLAAAVLPLSVARVHAAPSSHPSRTGSPDPPSSHPSRAGFPDPASSPKAQLPYLRRGQQRIGDSHFIIQHLVRWEGQGRGRLCVAAVPSSSHLQRRAATRSVGATRDCLNLRPLAAARVQPLQRCCTLPTPKPGPRLWRWPVCATQTWRPPSCTSAGWMMR